MDIVAVIQRVSRAVDDSSYTSGDILGYINDGLLAVAGEIPLPSLETPVTVATVVGQEYLDLPDDFHDHLRYVRSLSTQQQVRIYPDIARLYERTPISEGGLVRRAAEASGRLYYSPTPAAAEDLRIVYHKIPTPYTEGTGEPDYIPRHVGPRILEAYACKELWDLTEDGIDGAKVNTTKWEAKYNTLLDGLRLFLGPFYSRPVSEMETLDVMRL